MPDDNEVLIKVIAVSPNAAASVWTIRVKKRGGLINKELLVASGIIPVLLSLVIMDGAFSYLGQAGMHHVGISMFICVGFDFIAGVLALMTRYFGLRQPFKKQ